MYNFRVNIKIEDIEVEPALQRSLGGSTSKRGIWVERFICLLSFAQTL